MAQLFVSFDADGSLQRIGRLDVFAHADGTGGDAALGGGDATMGGGAAQSRPQNCPTDGCQTKGGHFGKILILLLIWQLKQKLTARLKNNNRDYFRGKTNNDNERSETQQCTQNVVIETK